jgi:predicted nucleotidyltransferase
MSAVDILRDHKELARRRKASAAQLERLRKAFANEALVNYPNVTVFSAGSLGRLEAGNNSDLDIFVIASPHEIGRLREIRLLSKIADLNDSLKFPPFSDEMRYMKVYDGEKLIKDTGKPRDDSENSFTTRMLLLLESAHLTNNDLYQKLMKEVCENYFRDNKGKKDFRPLFLINDLLRYWRTLCLNYEQCREDPDKPWRKKNMNLRFSRLTTVFATIALLMIDRPSKAEDFISHTALTPLERLAVAVDKLGNVRLEAQFESFLDHYATFLRIKDSASPEKMLEKGDIKQKVRDSADKVADFFSDIFEDKSLKTYSRYLVL